MGSIEAVRADITGLAVDAIVNAANSTLLGGGGVDGAIHRAAGAQLREFCARLGGCPAGQARITPGFRLPARHVIHTVGPVWHGGNRGEAGVLAACYRNCFALAGANGVRSIAFPAISCGAYGYPPERAATVALRECRNALVASPQIERVLLVAFDEAMRACYERLLGDGP
jgi:O-acetyl-ADP-ribose deacetylase (regulator of RNase III)